MLTIRPAVLVLLVVATALAVPAQPQAQRVALDELLMDMNITPIDREPPPALTVTTLDGGRVSLADLRGHVVLVYFWATW